MSACCPTCGLAAPSSTAVGLTTRQRQILEYLEQCGARGVSPTYREIADTIGVTSKSGVHRLVRALKDRGYIRHTPHHSQSIIVIGSEPQRAAA